MFNPCLYVIVDATDNSLAVCKKAISGGATAIQLRDKKASRGELVRIGKVLHKITKKAGIPLIINDYPDVALAIGAEGVHLGQDDMPVAMARRLLERGGLHIYSSRESDVASDESRSMSSRQARTIKGQVVGPKKIIGVSVKTVAQAKKAQRGGADYLGVGPIFATKTKADAGKSIGLSRLTSIVKSVSIPVVAIGGINAKNAKEVMETGANGLAVISAVMEAKDPERVTRKLRTIVDNNR